MDDVSRRFMNFCRQIALDALETIDRILPSLDEKNFRKKLETGYANSSKYLRWSFTDELKGDVKLVLPVEEPNFGNNTFFHCLFPEWIIRFSLNCCDVSFITRSQPEIDVPLLFLIIALERNGLQCKELRKQLPVLQDCDRDAIMQTEKNILASAPILIRARCPVANTSLHPIWGQVSSDDANREEGGGGDRVVERPGAWQRTLESGSGKRG
eukprot:767451-Hanusia_phi.AAC.8